MAITIYTKNDILNALRKLGLKKGDIIFSHSNLAYFGVPQGGASKENLKNIFIDSIFELIGPEGTFVVPTFTYTFPGKGVFDQQTTESVCGVLTEIVRQDPKAYRCDDPLFSVAAIGARAREMTENVSSECFGKNSFWDRFYQANGVVINFNFGAAVTYFHFIEQSINVAYRYNKLFFPKILKNGEQQYRPTIFFCRDMSDELLECDWLGIDELARRKGICNSVDVARGYISYINSREIFDLIEQQVKDQPFFLTKARDVEVKPSLMSEKKAYSINLSLTSTMNDVIEELQRSPRDMVSDGIDSCFKVLQSILNSKIYEYSTGTQCGNWVVPEKWMCYQEQIETIDGKSLLTYESSTPSVVSYSKSFEGMVSRQELIKHLLVSKDETDSCFVQFLYYESDWKFACSEQFINDLKESQYRVVIKSEFSKGSLKIAESFIPGGNQETIVICAHLSDQYFQGDGLAGVAVAVEVFKELQRNQNLSLSYRLLIVPHAFNISLYLNDQPELVSKIQNVLFLDELSGNGQFIFKEINQLKLNTSFEHDYFCKSYDELSMLQLSRVGRSKENNQETLNQAKQIVMEKIEKWEANQLARK